MDFNVTVTPPDAANDGADDVESSDCEVSLLHLVLVNFDSHGRMHSTNRYYRLCSLLGSRRRGYRTPRYD